MSAKRLVDVLRGLRGMGQGDPRAWAYALRDREQRGEQLSETQRAMWREALNAAGPIFARPMASDADINDAKTRAQRQVDDYQGR